MFGLRLLMLTAAVVATVAWIVADTSRSASSAAGERTPAFVALGAAVGGSAPVLAQVQEDEDAAGSDGDERVPVQVWTVFAAGAAAGVGLVLYLLRLAMGWVRPPPSQEEGRH